MTASDIAAEIRRHRFSYAHETDLQLGIAKLFGDRLKREFALTVYDRPDFFDVEGGIVVEVKIKGSAGSVLIQLERYSLIESVKGLVLVTTRATQALRMPYVINGKPLAICHLFSL